MNIHETYSATTLAIIDYKIDELVNQKSEIDNRLARLYELRENLVVEIENQNKKVEECRECLMHDTE